MSSNGQALRRSALAALTAVLVVPAAAMATAANAAAGPVVTEMIVGPNGTLFGPRGVDAAATAVAVASRRCRIAAATPLAALSGARGLGGPAFGLRDYGACSLTRRTPASCSSPRSAASPTSAPTAGNTR